MTFGTLHRISMWSNFDAHAPCVFRLTLSTKQRNLENNEPLPFKQFPTNSQLPIISCNDTLNLSTVQKLSTKHRFETKLGKYKVYYFKFEQKQA